MDENCFDGRFINRQSLNKRVLNQNSFCNETFSRGSVDDRWRRLFKGDLSFSNLKKLLKQ